MHCHLLPHVDDGFVEWENLDSYLSLYKRCGFSGVIFTPHLYDPYVRTDVMALRSAWARAGEMAGAMGLFSALASEIYVSDQEVVKGIPALGKYALVEFNIDYAPSAFFEKLESLSPLIPIIAHIERYKWLSPESETVRELKERGYDISLANGRFAKPLDTELIDRLCRSHKVIVTLEENVERGGIGTCICSYIHSSHPEVKVLNITIPDAYVEHGDVTALRSILKIDSDSVILKMEEEGIIKRVSERQDEEEA